MSKFPFVFLAYVFKFEVFTHQKLCLKAHGTAVEPFVLAASEEAEEGS